MGSQIHTLAGSYSPLSLHVWVGDQEITGNC